MQTGPLTPVLAARLVDRHVHEPFPASWVADLLRVLLRVSVEPDDVLMRQGEAGANMYLVLSGRLAIFVQDEHGVRSKVDEVGPGNVVGEMALLTGVPRTATVIATEPGELAALSRPDFEQLAARHPAALAEFLRRILPRLRRTQMVAVLGECFGPLDAAALADLEAALQWVSLPGGATLFREGDAGGDVFIVINGRLRVVAKDADGGERRLEESGRGAMVGEVALLTGEPRSATVRAVRDSDLLRLTTEAYDALIDRHPRAMLQVARSAAWRLRHQSHPQGGRKGAPSTFALLGVGPGAPLSAFAARLADTLRSMGRLLQLDSAEVDRLLGRPGIAQSDERAAVNASIVAWLAAQEREHDHVVLVADAGDTAWTRRCLRQADRILLVADASGPASLVEARRLLDPVAPDARADLVLVHPDDLERPAGTAAWLEGSFIHAHHHVRLGHERDLRRVARRVSGRAVGLVLGGGGARGFAHIGVLRALAEAGIEIDVVGGTSIGSLIAAAHAAGIGVDRMLELARSFASPRKLLDRTLPVTALMAGRKVTRLYQELFGDLPLEDLWTPCFAVSSGLSRADVVVHARGTLWKAIRASTAIPAIFPPLLHDDGEVLVDGNVMNNMPLDVMRAWCEGGTVIGVNPMPTADKRKAYHFGSSLSGWSALLGRLGWSRVRSPSILGAVMRATEINSANRMRQPAFRGLADLLIEPPLENYPILAFAEYEPIVDIGYRVAAERLAAWRASAPGVAG